MTATPELGELAAIPAAPPGLWECLQKMTDPRKRRGVRHRITGVLAMAWAADAGPGELAALGLRGVVPCESTIRRCLQRLDPSSLDALIGGWMWLQTGMLEGRRVIALDGKSVRGARVVSAHRDRPGAASGGCKDQRNPVAGKASGHHGPHRCGDHGGRVMPISA